MTEIALSIVVPAFNEEAGIADCVGRWIETLERRGLAWEIVVVDDGSRDRTASIVTGLAAVEPRVRLVRGPHAGKGAAVRHGMLAARGAWRFFGDADLSMPPDNLDRFLSALRNSRPVPHVLIGSREAPGARRTGEPWQRHALGRVYNWAVQAIAVPGIRDTQCGFKLFSAASTDVLFAHSRINGFAFDVEILFLARRMGLTVAEVGIEWHARRDGRVTLRRGAAAFFDIARVRWQAWRGDYRSVPAVRTAVHPIP